jgi:DNA-binding NtrC family response regulator
MSDTLRIVLVDNHPEDRALVVGELCREFPALEVVHVTDHDSFSKALAAEPFDLVITDFQLHWTTGLEILQAVKKSVPTCPVIMYTGAGSEAIAVAGMKSGLDDYVLKASGHLARLPAAVRSALERARQRQRDALSQREKLAPIGQVLAGVAHELNNPLSVILGHAAILHRVLADSPDAAHVERIVQAAQQCAQIAKNALMLAGGGAPVVVRGARILVVDDEPGIAGVLAEVLQLDGHRVETVGNGEAALGKLAVEKYELILSDVRMPDLDGPTLYREVERRHPDLLRRFIFLTGDVMSPETTQFLSQTGVPCLSKPFTLEMVREAVQRALIEASER